MNSQSGVRTPAGGLWTGALILLALGLLTPLFKYIPSAALAGVIIMAVLDMVSFSLLIKLWRVKSKLLYEYWSRMIKCIGRDRIDVLCFLLANWKFF